ncbi:iron-containing redox enzyme family protein [Rhizobium sp. BT-175]|uniref:iron-containing redox enzyme family protein n=1 Tax=Rhizobium sp. BT-175 TaxID=2986929 RepID=UPI002235E931|nr:iron-containing redox enzyme family protein [Rhizobium sp. BT-175]MCV9947654.1 iron-containing redox enzyme family protein [Rhizobium sp. BT-175]
MHANAFAQKEMPSSCLQLILNAMPDMDRKAWRSANRDYALRQNLAADCLSLVETATQEGFLRCEPLHNVLKALYDREFASASPVSGACDVPPMLRDITHILEDALIEHEIQRASHRVGEYPKDGSGYVHWLKRLISEHRASHHPYYHSYIENHGTREDLRYLLAQETCIDPRFDDILALIQLGARGEAKLELASNYWDEMGNGSFADMHSILFDEALVELDISLNYIAENFLFEAKVCGNISAALALRRQYYHMAIGYFGVTEYLVPRRFRKLISAWKRLGLPKKGMHYHDLHIGVDAGHAAGWFKNVVQPAIDHDPQVGRDIALGALIRLDSSEQYLDAVLARTDFANAITH